MSPSKQKFIFIAFIILTLICLNLFYFYFKPQSQAVSQSNNCPITETIKTIRGGSMEPLIGEGEELVLMEGWYQCNKVQTGDIIAYNYKGNENPLIKKVRVVGEDVLEFEGNNLLVNGGILKNSQNQPYIFAEKQKKMIGLYIKNGKLVENSYLIFSDNPSNGLDSRQFGAVSANNFLGKFED